jgi:hypothetical protein
MKKAFPIALMILGLVFLGAGIYTVVRGFDAKDQVREELVSQAIVTPADASIPNATVDDPATAKSMADVIKKHSLEATDGKTYAELGRYLAKDGTDTSDEALALKGADGKPVANPVRNTAFQASSLRTGLYTSVMAWNVSDLVIGLGAMIAAVGIALGGVGVALAGLSIPAFSRKLHVEPVAVAH